MFPMLLKSYHHLHPLSKGEILFPNINEEDCNLDNFEMMMDISELAKELVN